MKDKQRNGRRVPTEEESDMYFAGAEAALRRAAIKARKRAIELTGSVPTWRDGKIVYDTEVWPDVEGQAKQDGTGAAR